MPRPDLDIHFKKIDELILEINTLVPSGPYRTVQFRADLAGLLVVAMAATYETCVKEILYEHANKKHSSFGEFALRNYKKLNSRVQVRDLRNYCDTFNPHIKDRFKLLLSERKSKLLERTGRNIESAYEQILSWRHDFAHAGIRQTTIEEAANTHRLGKRVIYIFDEAFA